MTTHTTTPRRTGAPCELSRPATFGQRVPDRAASADQRTHVGILALDHAGRLVGHAICCRLDELGAEHRQMLSVFRDEWGAHELVTAGEVDIDVPSCAGRLLSERLHA